MPPRQAQHPDAEIGHPPDERPVELGVYERTAFFVNPTAGSPVGGAKEILFGAESAGVTLPSFNVGDGGSWADWYGLIWQYDLWPEISTWARCDNAIRCQELSPEHECDIANIESPEIVNGFCTPAHALQLVGEDGAYITEGIAPHADWSPCGSQPVFLEIDPTVAPIRDKLNTIGIQGLLDYAKSLGILTPVPCFFIVPNDHWNGDQQTFHTYWEWLREMWGEEFGLYPAEAVPDWTVIK